MRLLLTSHNFLLIAGTRPDRFCCIHLPVVKTVVVSSAVEVLTSTLVNSETKHKVSTKIYWVNTTTIYTIGAVGLNQMDIIYSVIMETCQSDKMQLTTAI